MTAPSIVVHLKERDAAKQGRDALQGRHLRLYRVLRDIAARDGIRFEIRQRDADIRIATRSAPDGRFNDGNLHILDDRSVRADNVLNASSAYFWDFWHLDPKGTKAFSSIGDQPFDAAKVDMAWAQPFFDRLHRSYVGKRRSKYAQPEDYADSPEGCIAVFCQGDYPIQSGAGKYSDVSMVEAVLAGAGTQPVVVKPHPKASNAADIAALTELAQRHENLSVTQANIHDILAQCSITASHNSTVALEGYLHQKPAILFAQSDFLHIATTVSDDLPFRAALETALAREGDYEKYLTWYFKRKCLWLARASVEDQIWAIFTAAGFPKSRFRLNRTGW